MTKSRRSSADSPVPAAPREKPATFLSNRGDALPLALPPRGLSRVQAAAYIGVSPTLFDILVADGRMPNPKRINARRVWDLRKLDRAFDALPAEEPDEFEDPARRWHFAV